MTYQVTQDLVDKFQTLDRRKKDAAVERTAKVILGPSVVRVFKSKTSADLGTVLKSLDLDELRKCRTQKQFDNFFFDALSKVDRAILEKNRNNSRVGDGHKWGHAAKVLCLYLRDLVLYTRYFADEDALRLQDLLYMPVDSVVMKQLRACGVRITPERIKEIDSEDEFRAIQALFTEAARQARVPRILFDDVWGEDR